MAFEINRWLTWENTKKFIGVVLCLSVLVVVWRTTRLFYSPIVNSIEIQNGTFNYTSSSTELQTAISAGNLLSSIVVAGATIIYAVFTYFILDATNKNTQQSSLSIQQTAKAQEIAYLGRRLEKFYLPMENALQKVDLKSIKKFNQMVDKKETPHYSLYSVNQMWWSFRDDYDKVVPFTYLASDDVKINIEKFTNIFLSNRLFSEKFTVKWENTEHIHNYPDVKINECIKEGLDEKYLTAATDISEYHDAALAKIKEDIKSISKKLAELVKL